MNMVGNCPLVLSVLLGLLSLYITCCMTVFFVFVIRRLKQKYFVLVDAQIVYITLPSDGLTGLKGEYDFS